MRFCTLAFVLLAIPSAWAQQPLDAELTRLGVHTARLYKSAAVEGAPAWSLDSRYLAAYIDGTWYKLDTSKLDMEVIPWHETPIAITGPTQKTEEITEQEFVSWQKQQGNTHPTGKAADIKATFRRTGYSTALVMSRGKKKIVLWQSDLENCGSLTRSPDGKYLAYVCEKNGVFVTDVAKAFDSSEPSPYD